MSKQSLFPSGERKKLKVAVIFGGRSGEHEVSIISAKSIMNALDKSKYEILPVYIDKMGQWLTSQDPTDLISGKGSEQIYLSADPKKQELVSVDKKSEAKIDVVFPVLHGTYGEDGTIQGLLELTNIPFVGSGVLGSALGMDKGLMKKVFQAEGLPVVKYQVIYRDQLNDSTVENLLKEFGYPMFVKPANLGSSVGISKVHNREEVRPALELAASYDRKILVERGVEGIRELEISVLGNLDPEASVVGEIIPKREFYDYEAKYIDNSSELVIPANISVEEQKEIANLAIKAFRVLELRGMARVDFFLEKSSGKVYLNEVNTIPGFTSISMYPKLWEASGLSYSDLLDKLIELALEENEEKNKNTTNFDSKLLT